MNGRMRFQSCDGGNSLARSVTWLIPCFKHEFLLVLLVLQYSTTFLKFFAVKSPSGTDYIVKNYVWFRYFFYLQKIIILD